jgi:hypothetical protein
VNRRSGFADRASAPVDGLLFENNIIDVAQAWMTPFKAASNNLYSVHDPFRDDPPKPETFSRYMPGATCAETPGFAADPPSQWPVWGSGGGEAFFFVNPVGSRPARRFGQIDFHLTPGSKAVDAGTAGADDGPVSGRAPDLGAIELGQHWEFPPPGPRWATFDNAPNRPPLPPELKPEFAGLPAEGAAESGVPLVSTDEMEDAKVARAFDAYRIALPAFTRRVGYNVRPTETVQRIAPARAEEDMPDFADKGQKLWEVRVAEMLDGEPLPETVILVHPLTEQVRFLKIRGE